MLRGLKGDLIRENRQFQSKPRVTDQDQGPNLVSDQQKECKVEVSTETQIKFVIRAIRKGAEEEELERISRKLWRQVQEISFWSINLVVQPKLLSFLIRNPNQYSNLLKLVVMVLTQVDKLFQILTVDFARYLIKVENRCLKDRIFLNRT